MMLLVSPPFSTQPAAVTSLAPPLQSATRRRGRVRVLRDLLGTVVTLALPPPVGLSPTVNSAMSVPNNGPNKSRH